MELLVEYGGYGQSRISLLSSYFISWRIWNASRNPIVTPQNNRSHLNAFICLVRSLFVHFQVRLSSTFRALCLIGSHQLSTWMAHTLKNASAVFGSAGVPGLWDCSLDSRTERSSQLLFQRFFKDTSFCSGISSFREAVYCFMFLSNVDTVT